MENEMNTRFSGKVVVVAGGTGGLGQAVSVAFLKEEARVIVTFRDQPEFAALADAVGRAVRSKGTPWMSRMNLP